MTMFRHFRTLLLTFLFQATCYGQDARLVIPTGHTAYINSVQISHDGKKAVTASQDHGIKIWEAESGKLLLELNRHQENINTVCFSGDSKRILSASDDRSAKVWDSRNGALLLDLGPHSAAVNAACFSPDGGLIATICEQTAWIWNGQTGKSVNVMRDPFGKLWDASISPDGRRLLTVAREGDAASIKLWDLQTGRMVKEVVSVKEAVTHARFSPDGNVILTTGAGQSVPRLWEVATGQLLRTFDIPSVHQFLVRFAPDGLTMATAAEDRKIRIWDVASGTVLHTLSGHSRDVSDLSFTPDGRRIISGTLREGWLWDIAASRTVAFYKGHSASSFSAHYSPDGRKLLVISTDGTVKIMDPARAELLFFLRSDRGGIVDAGFSPDNLRIVTASTDSAARIWDAQTGRLLLRIDGHRAPLQSAQFSPDGKRVLTSAEDATARVWESETGKLLFEVTGPRYGIRYAHYAPDGRRFVTTEPEQVRIWNAENGKLAMEIPGDGGLLQFARFSADGNRIVSVSTSKVLLSNSHTGKKIRAFSGPNGPIRWAEVSADKKWLATGCFDNMVRIYDLESGMVATELKGHTGVVTSVKYMPDDGGLVTTSMDGTVRLWDLLERKERLSFINLDSADYLVRLPSGYYKSTPDAARLLHYVTPELRVISFAQLDVKFNRPDVVLATLPNPDTALISSYRKAYLKRIRRLGLDTSSFDEDFTLPVAEIKGRDTIAFEQKGDKLRVHFVASDETFPLDHFNVWINEVPLFGIKGIALRRKGLHNFDTSLLISLSQGLNVIEASVTNTKGAESYRMPLEVTWSPPIPARERVHFIGIGIDRFKERGYTLNYSVKDIRDLATRLKRKYGAEIIIDTLFNEAVTVQNIKALKKNLLTGSINDKVILSYSGHGLLSKDYEYYLSTYPVDFTHPEKGGLPYELLESLLDSIPSRRKLMLIDACHSGEVDKEEITQASSLSPQAPSSAEASRGILPRKNAGSLGMQNSFELMGQLFVNVGRSTGATIISAAGGTQYAQERGNLRNGVFTYSILEYLDTHNAANVNELKKYVNRRVPELTNGAQQPTSRSENRISDWSVW